MYVCMYVCVCIYVYVCIHRRREGLKVGGVEVSVVAAEVDPRRGGLGAQPPDADEGIIPCNSKVAPK